MLLTVFLIASVLPASAQTVRLSPTFEFESVVGSVRDFRLKSNGAFAFFLADERQGGVVELFTVPALGGVEPFRENRTLYPDRSVIAFEPTAVGNFIVFLADQDADDVFELFSRTVGDLAPRKLSGTMVLGGDVKAFRIAADGVRAVYLADQDADEVFELYSVPVNASTAAVKLSGMLVPGGDVAGPTPMDAFQLSATNRVVFTANKADVQLNELYSVPIDGSALPVKLNGALVTGGDVWHPLQPSGGGFRITTDGTTVVYRADQAADEVYELFRVPADGSSGAVRVHPVFAADRDVSAFDLSPDGARVVYTADQTTNNVLETYSVPLDGSAAPVRLSNAGQPASLRAVSPDSSYVVLQGSSDLFGAPLDGSAPAVQLDHSTLRFDDVTISPDSARVVYRLSMPATQQGACDQNVELRSVPLDASAVAVRLDDPTGFLADSCYQALGPVEEVPFAISPDSSKVVYRWSSEGPPGLVTAPIDGSGPPVMLSAGNVGVRFALNPAGTRIFFQADPSGGEALDLFSASASNGTGRVKLNGRLARDTFADVAGFAGDSAGERVVFTADRNVDGEPQVYSAPVDGRGPRLRLSTSGVAEDFLPSPDRAFVVYRARAAVPFSARDLFSVHADGSQGPVQLNGALSGTDSVGFFGISADDQRVVYAVGSIFGSPSTLHSVPIAGGASPTQLTSNAGSWITLGAGSRVVFVRGFGAATDRLFSVPVAGGSAPLELAPGLGGYHRNLRLTPGGGRVVFNAGVSRLYGVPVDGSASPLLLSGSLPFTGASKLSPDGEWAVFWAGELYSARIDGTSGPLSLSGPLTTGGAVPEDSLGPIAFISSDSSRVVYLADQETDDVFELYSVPIDGSAAAIKLNAVLAPGGDVVASNFGGLQLAPDGTHVVYAADQDQDDVLELYSVPLDGSAASIKLNAALGPYTDIDLAASRSFRITPDSKLVVYTTETTNTTGTLVVERLRELHLVPIDRALEPIRLHGQLANSGYPLLSSQPGGIDGFEITPDSRRVLYTATVRSQVLELFSTVLSFNPARGHLGPAQQL